MNETERYHQSIHAKAEERITSLETKLDAMSSRMLWLSEDVAATAKLAARLKQDIDRLDITVGQLITALELLRPLLESHSKVLRLHANAMEYRNKYLNSRFSQVDEKISTLDSRVNRLDSLHLGE